MNDTAKWKYLSYTLGVLGGVGWGLYIDCSGRCLTPSPTAAIRETERCMGAEQLSTFSVRGHTEREIPSDTRHAIQKAEATPVGTAAAAVDTSLEWRVGMQMEEIQRAVSLTSEEQQKLLDALRSQQRERYSSSARYDDLVSRAIGADRMEQIRSSLAAQEVAEQDRRVQEETILLSRRLQLSGEQEEALAQVIRQVELGLSQRRTAVAAVTEEVMSKHMSSSPTQASRAELRDGYAQIKDLNEKIKQDRQTAMGESLRAILSPSQYEQYINTSVEARQ